MYQRLWGWRSNLANLNKLSTNVMSTISKSMLYRRFIGRFTVVSKKSLVNTLNLLRKLCIHLVPYQFGRQTDPPSENTFAPPSVIAYVPLLACSECEPSLTKTLTSWVSSACAFVDTPTSAGVSQRSGHLLIYAQYNHFRSFIAQLK